jgi:amino acid transporter
MRKAFSYFLNNWWVTIIFCILAVLLMTIGALIQIKDSTLANIYDYVTFIIFGLSLLMLFISIIFQLKKRRWWKAILSFVFFLLTIGAFFIYTIFLVFLGPNFDGTDKWADELTIPTDIQIEDPIYSFPFNNEEQDSIWKLTKIKTDFQLYEAFQPGIYRFDFWTDRIEKGIIYIKAYEITQNKALSEESVTKRSVVEIYNPTDSIVRFKTSPQFTIYEGDWGKPYAARFEVWFKPDTGGKERKLIEKNYKIEGWQR